MRFYLLDIDYLKEKNQTRARLFVKGEGKYKEILVPFDSYFLVLPEEGRERAAKEKIEQILKAKNRAVKRIEIQEKIINGKRRKVLKIICFFPPDTQNIRDIIKRLEKKRGGSGEIVEEYEYSLSFLKCFF